jgi:AcrR family transcriptional regulator
MVEAISQHGYAETTVGELVALAGVSKSTFYQHFHSKEECFLATLDTIVDVATDQVGLAYRSESGLREALKAAFVRFAWFVEEESAAANLVLVDSLSLGAPAVPHLERAFRSFEMMFTQSFARDPGEAEPTEIEIRAIVAGIKMVAYRCLRAGHPEELSTHIDAILDWAISYRNGRPGMPLSPRGFPPQELPEAPAELNWREPADSELSRTNLSQRDRIIRAAAQVAAESGYDHVTIPAISAASGTSNQTFYEHFESKEQAFIVAFERLSQRVLEAAYAAGVRQPNWRAAVEAGIGAFLEHIAEDHLFARLAFFELPTAGAAALDKADREIGRFMAYLQPEALPEEIEPLPPVVVDAIGGGIWGAIQHEIVVGSIPNLPRQAPQLAAIALKPFGV